MIRRRHLVIIAAAMVAACAVTAISQSAESPKPVLYVVGTSHLDSQWNWTVQDTIRDFVPNTFFQNFQRFEKYPDYTFNYEGAMWFKEYHPEAWPIVQKYVAAGRWQVAGSWINAVDTNIPSPESLMRQALYGKRFFRQEFGKVSNDVYLPDCFGFGFALPAIASHCGLNQFSTQKLTWGSSYGIPFPLGRWKGSDGSTVIAALNPGDYVTRIRSDISVDPKWAAERMTAVGDRQIGFRYFGTGDIGGAPDDESVDWLEKSLKNKSGIAEVRNTSSDQLTRDLTAAEKSTLPEYEGELTMKTHGVGCYTSQAAMKRFNRENELLANAAEEAAVAAELVAGLPYPRERLREAWIRTLWHQFHDDLTGTSIPQAYQFSWNDELVSANQFAGVLTSSVAAIAGKMDTSGEGIPLIVYNPLAWTSEEPVEATVRFKGAAPATMHVVDHRTNEQLPTQILERHGDTARILFAGRLPPAGFRVVHVVTGAGGRFSNEFASAMEWLKAEPSSLESVFYKVQIDAHGDISSIVDKLRSRELLSGPVRLELRDDPSPDKPAWRILWETVNSQPREYVDSPEVRVVEQGPVRVALEIKRHAAGSTFVQRISLGLRGQRVDVENFVDWKSPNSLLKVAFPFTVSNPKATYDLGLGTIQRGNNTPDHYEVPAQQWADITSEDGKFGVAVLNDSKYGWDKPADNTLRLTLLHTARARAYPYQSSNDLGHHHFTYAIASHRGDWRIYNPAEDPKSFVETGVAPTTAYGTPVPGRAAQLNQRPIAFQTEAHRGALGRWFSAVNADNDLSWQIAVRALKKAEDGDEYILRLQELEGRPAAKYINFGLPLQSAREINAAEEPTARAGDLKVGSNNLQFSLKPYQPRTLALRFRSPNKLEPNLSAVSRALHVDAMTTATPLELPFNLDGISNDANRADGDFDGKGQTLAAELLPANLSLDGLPFKFGPAANGALNVLVPSGQTIKLPAGDYNRVYFLAAAVGGDIPTEFGGQALTIREWQGPVGQWDSRLKEPRQLREVSVAPMTAGQTWTADAINQDLVVQYDASTGVVKGIDQIRRGFVKREEIGWVGSHRHDAQGNQPYIGSYLFLYAIDLPAGSRELRLPNDNRIRIMAMTAAREPYRLWPAAPLYSSDLPTR
ncbi:MAG TPA: glycoside hydrolase family 38 C-terminal domain-containing protein [Pyrinomonadaceae bacterium]|nr:glycoside hydrolase family 38 C-terminal domain-containing protein [Pyrinomonadaceae bacterium]